MSTNFYLRSITAKDDSEDLHIGLSSSSFLELEAHPRRGIVAIRDWRARIAQPQFIVVNDSEETIEKEVFLARMVKERDQMAVEKRPIYVNCPQCPPANMPMKGQRYKDDEGYLFCNYVFS